MREMRLIYLLIIICILLSSLVISIGISVPEKNFYFFEPGAVISQKYSLVGGKNRPFKVSLGGDLAQYAELVGRTSFKFKTDERKIFEVRLTLPDTLTLGPHELMVGAIEDKPKSSGMSAIASVGTQITVMVPYRGKYPVTKFSSTSAKLGEVVKFVGEIQNWGDVGIISAKAKISIFDSESSLVGEVDSTESSVAPKLKKILTARWVPPSELLPGKYPAKIKLTMDNIVHNHSLTVRLGEEDIILVKYPVELEAGKINEILISVKSIWNSLISNIDITLQILGYDDAVLLEIKSPVFDLRPWETKEVPLYVNLPYAWSGKYDARLILGFLDEHKVENFELAIIKKSEALTERETDINKGFFRLALILFLLVLVVVNLGVYRYLKNKCDSSFESAQFEGSNLNKDKR